MARDIETITNAIESILAGRESQLPTIQSELGRVAQREQKLVEFRNGLIKLRDVCSDDEVSSEVAGAIAANDKILDELKDRRQSLEELQAEFKRGTLNIGVSGAARTGKSTTLQHITGLSDQQIPSGGLNPVTAVRSEIYNSSRKEAVVSFLSENEFIEGYARVHVENVNEYLPKGESIVVRSLSELKSVKLPERLAGKPSSMATDSLKRLKEAQRSADSYGSLLGSRDKVIPLDKIRDFTTYPTPEEETAEINGEAIASRRYLAVKLVQVFCQFPNLGSAKVGLVDFPGLGEIGSSANELHLNGLEDKIDQILLVMRPTAAKAFTDAGVGHNLDQLQRIQPAVRRGDLILIGINKDVEAGQGAADNLRAHFNEEINNGRDDGGFDIVDYNAMNDDDVARLFDKLLDRLTELPKMDRQKIEYCMSEQDVVGRITRMANDVVASMDRVLRNIPSSDKVMNERILSISRSIVGELSDFAAKLGDAVGVDSEVQEKYKDSAGVIHRDVEERIENGLFMCDDAEWLDRTRSSKDFYNLYRDEAKRIRYELIDAYCGLDRFYDSYIDEFKSNVLDVILRACGMDGFFQFDKELSADEKITRVKSELGSTLHDDGLDAALDLLASVRFDFRSNVFLQIERHLVNLANPSDSRNEKRGRLGGTSSSAEKQEYMKKLLRDDATHANDSIWETLASEGDAFNRYLAVSIDFFNNALFGKDEESFKQVIIRGLIREYKEYVFPDADDASQSPVGLAARRIKEDAVSLKREFDAISIEVSRGASENNCSHGACGVTGKTPKVAVPKSTDGFHIGQVVECVVARLNHGGAIVEFDGVEGFIPTSHISQSWVDDPADFLPAGTRVHAKIIQTDGKPIPLVLSIKQCE